MFCFDLEKVHVTWLRLFSFFSVTNILPTFVHWL